MEQILVVGIIIFTGFIFGELCTHLKMPKVTGYILAGIALNPNLTHFIPNTFVKHTNLVTNIALAFITFSVGGTLLFSKVRSLGKSIILITIFESEFAFLFVAISSTILGPMLISSHKFSLSSFFIPLSLILGSLASPTDPTATLAVEHEYKAKGEVTSTIMGVAAFDDILGIINYSIATSIIGIIVQNHSLSIFSIAQPFVKIFGSIISGCIFGFFLNFLTTFIKKETEGVLITLIISLLALCYGLTEKFNFDELLSTMTMGIVVVNNNIKKEKIFKILERYTEELIFVLFFTISSMHLDFSVLLSNYMFIIVFVIFRSLGKLSGTFVGGKISNASSAVQKFAAGGLIPQGGIVIGLALAIKGKPTFDSISHIVINVIIGATIIHEIIGPLLSKFSLKKAGEITLNKKIK